MCNGMVSKRTRPLNVTDTDAKDFTDKGLHKGQTFTWDVYNDVATQGTTLTETSTIAETNFTIAQGTGTVTELGNAVNDDFELSTAARIAA
jgi:hypothetical protein